MTIWVALVLALMMCIMHCNAHNNNYNDESLYDLFEDAYEEGEEEEEEEVKIQFLSTHDWHGNVNPINGIGGSSVLDAYWRRDEEHEWKNSLRFTAGDAFGATPAVVSLFNEEPAVIAQRMMHFAADTLGNHNFDKGIAHLNKMVDLARNKSTAIEGRPFHYVVSNLENLANNLPHVLDREIITVGGVRVGVVGIMSPELADQMPVGVFGTLKIQDPVRMAMRTQKRLRREGAHIVVCLVHMGLKTDKPEPQGRLLDFAKKTRGFDIIFGDHTGIQWTGVVNGQTVLETKNFGASYARTRVIYNKRTERLVSTNVTFVVPIAKKITPTASIDKMVASFHSRLAPILSQVVGYSPRILKRYDCKVQKKGCETLTGDLLADAVRFFNVSGIDFGLLNQGGIRSDLTCTAPGGGGFCPTNSSSKSKSLAITKGTIYTVMPFENTVVTARVSGSIIHKMLQTGMKFNDIYQVSGLCYTYDMSTTPGRIVRAVLQDKTSGKCTETPIDFSSTENRYTLATIDFLANGAQDNPVLTKQPEYRTRETLRETVQGYLRSPKFTLPKISGRVVCTGSPQCPTPNA